MLFVEKSVEANKLQNDVVDWQNHQNRSLEELEEVNHQAQIDSDKALQIRWDADRDLVQAMKSLLPRMKSFRGRWS